MGPQQPGGRLERAGVVRSFDANARVYDRLVGANRGYHEHLRLSARRMGLPEGGKGLRLLDVGCGTGASTAALLDAAPQAAEIIGVDASTEMLAQAQRKSWPSTVRFVHGNAENLTMAKVDGPFDGIMAAYLLRNLVHKDAALRQFLALLRPGAPLALHEYSVKDSRRSRMRWNAVCWSVIIPMSRLRAGSTELYRYLWRSVLDFDGVRELTARMETAGFEDVRVQTVPGWQEHIVHTVLGRRPATDEPERPMVADLDVDPDAPTPPTGIDMSKPGLPG